MPCGCGKLLLNDIVGIFSVQIKDMKASYLLCATDWPSIVGLIVKKYISMMASIVGFHCTCLLLCSSKSNTPPWLQSTKDDLIIWFNKYSTSLKSTWSTLKQLWRIIKCSNNVSGPIASGPCATRMALKTLKYSKTLQFSAAFRSNRVPSKVFVSFLVSTWPDKSLSTSNSIMGLRCIVIILFQRPHVGVPKSLWSEPNGTDRYVNTELVRIWKLSNLNIGTMLI